LFAGLSAREVVLIAKASAVDELLTSTAAATEVEALLGSLTRTLDGWKVADIN